MLLLYIIIIVITIKLTRYVGHVSFCVTLLLCCLQQKSRFNKIVQVFFPQRTNATWTHVFFLFILQPISNFFITLKHDGLFLLYNPDYSTLYWIYFASTDRRTREANNCYFNEIAAEALCANYKNNLSIDMLVNLN